MKADWRYAIGWGIGLLGLYAWLYAIPRTDFFGYLAGMSIGFVLLAAALWLYSQQKSETLLTFFVSWGIGVRVLALIYLPQLSDDYFRFVWDGKMIYNGFNPYLYLPDEIYKLPELEIMGFSESLYAHLNSPHYYSVYPPLCQFFFAIATYISPYGIAGNVFVLKAFVLIAEILNIYFIKKLLQKYQLPAAFLLLYVLHPLVITEFMGNIHWEAWMLTGILGGVWAMEKGGKMAYTKAGIWWALAICAKLLPLIALPFFLLKIKNLQNSAVFLLSTVVVCVVCFLPFFQIETLINIYTSTKLYFTSFEFNGSLYYLLRGLGNAIVGYNPIETLSKILPLLIIAGIVGISLYPTYSKQKDFQPQFYQLLAVFALYFFCATTVNPWYILPLYVFSLFTHYRFVFIWTLLLPLTYITYQYTPYQENLWMVAGEYIIVIGWAIKEITANRTMWMGDKEINSN